MPHRECLFVAKIFPIFVVLGRKSPSMTYSKVFSLLSLRENVEVFNNNRTTNSTHFLYRLWNPIFHIYPSVGYRVVYCCYGSFHNLHVDKRNSAPHLNHNCFYNLLKHNINIWHLSYNDTTMSPLSFILPNYSEHLCSGNARTFDNRSHIIRLKKYSSATVALLNHIHLRHSRFFHKHY